jgi:DNA-binding NarL/FixJ family response regulator
MNRARTALLVGGDLGARARVDAAASGTGVTVVTTTPERMADAMRSDSLDFVILDLDTGRERVLQALQDARADGSAPNQVVGYFSHIDRELGEAARRAGCRAVPRGAFWRDLPALFAEG